MSQTASKHDIIVIGASSGGVEALQKLVSLLPADFPAAVFIVLHLVPWCPSDLPYVLSRRTVLPVHQAATNQMIESGTIYVAPPDFHLLVEEHRVVLWRGPKENLHRPSVNTMFRSAAVAHGERVVGVVLTGALDDGSTGLWWVKRYGGVTVVQDPNEATYPEMPANAMQHVDVDHVLPLTEIARLLVELACTKDHSGQSGEKQTSREETAAWKQNRA